MRNMPLFFKTILVLSFLVLVPSCNKETPASFTPSTTLAHVNEEITFTNTTKGGHDFFWNFGDGKAAYTKSTSHVYESAGIYRVTLDVYSHHENTSCDKDITVIQ